MAALPAVRAFGAPSEAASRVQRIQDDIDNLTFSAHRDELIRLRSFDCISWDEVKSCGHCNDNLYATMCEKICGGARGPRCKSVELHQLIYVMRKCQRRYFGWRT
eukprot:NODE_23294_length_672_cov_2.822018.p1 GENE.NODE_23294_length_672_cov_2.822018~~NODE_23294_length_672_cov_2.822018.p1  ORF type:complete len:105 (+),score=9.81 NODE_23294_length_672_cov_2.822018:246-560(+)